MPPIKRRILRLVCTLIVAMAGLWVVQPPVSSQPLPPMAGSATPATLTPELRRKIHPLLLKQLLNAGQQSTADIRVVVMLREQADLNAKTITSAASPLDRRAALVSVLQATADRSQAGVRAFLASEQAAGRAIQVRPLWIVNAIGARVAPSVIYALAARDDVRLIQPDQ